MARKATAAEQQLTFAYLDYLESLMTRAEDEICGVWYNATGRAKHADGLLDQWDMFRRPWHHVARYASEELTEFFRMNGRLTFTDYRSQMRQERTYADV